MNNFTRSSAIRSQRSSRVLCAILIFALVVFTTMVPLSISAYAAGGVDFGDVMQLGAYIKQAKGTNNTSINFSQYTSNVVASTTSNTSGGNSSPADWKAPTANDLDSSDIPSWDILVEMSKAQNSIASDFPTVKSCCATASQIVNIFGESANYNQAIGKLRTIGWKYDATNKSFRPDAGGDQKALDDALGKFKSSAASAAADNAFGDIYDAQNWDPNAGVAGDFLQGVYGVVNTIFYAVSNLMLWFFLLQTGFDSLYIIAEPVRPFIGPRNSSSNGGFNNGGGNGKGNILSKIHIPICSSSVEQACNGGGGIGGNGAGGASQGNAFASYAIKRFPILLCCAVYLILVTLGYWPKLISWVSGFAVDIIDFIMRIGK